MPTRPAPPPPKKPNTILKVVKAVFHYSATRADEVSFQEGDQIYILSEPESGWYLARIGHPERGASGLIPSNYVEENTETVENPLHEAAKRGNMDFLSNCLANKLSPNGLDYAGCTPLHWAAAGGYDDCLKLLLSQPKILTDVQNKLGDTPLHQAAWKGQALCVEMLLEAGAKVDLKNKDNLTPFKLAKDPQTQALLRDLSKVNSATNYSDYIDDDAADDSD